MEVDNNIVEVVSREKLKNLTVKYADESNRDSLPTMYSVIKAAKEIKLDNDEAKVLMGTNVYTITYKPFVKALSESFEKINIEDVNDTMIKKLEK